MTSDDLDLIPALRRAEIALRIAAVDRGDVGSTLEKLHLEGLADTLAAQIRIEQASERAALAAI